MKQLLKRPLLALMALMGVHQHLSAQQKQDISTAALQAAPGVVSTGALKVSGFGLADLVAVLTAVFIVLQIAHLVWKWRRQSRIDAELREQNKCLPQTDWGKP